MSVFYSKPQRLDVYVDNSLVAPTNVLWNSDNTDYTLKKPSYPGTTALHMRAGRVRRVSAVGGMMYVDCGPLHLKTSFSFQQSVHLSFIPFFFRST